MSKQEKEIWLDDAQYEGMIEGGNELEWLLNEVNEDIKRCEHSYGIERQELPNLYKRRNNIIKELIEYNKMLMRVHHIDEFVSEDSDEINRMIEEYENENDDDYDPILAEEFRRHEEDERRERKIQEDLERYEEEMNRSDDNTI